MNIRHWLVAGVTVVVTLGTMNTAQAWPHWVRRHGKPADRNRDGHVDPAERKHAADKDKDGVVEPAEAHRAAVLAKSRVDRPWEAKADANHDGRVSVAELKDYRLGIMDANRDGIIEPVERHAFWVSRKFRVTTAVEKKYDANGDGLLSGDEIVEYLKDKWRVISTDGRAIANTPLEQEFDADNDGVISAEEAHALKDAIGP